MPHASRQRGVLALLVVCALGGRALADGDLLDFDDREGRGDGFWARVSHPNHGRWRALVNEARKALGENEPKRALGLLEEAVKLEPTEPEGHFYRGRVLAILERWGECAGAYDRVLKLNPRYVPPAQSGNRQAELPFDFQVAICLAMSGRLEESVPFYQRIIAGGQLQGRDRAVVLWNLGDSYQALGRLEEAIDAYRDGIEAQPPHAMLRLALGVAYDRDGQVALAVDSVQEALGIDPSASMTSPEGSRALFVPKEDEDYYRGLAHKVARRRSLAIVYFRSYLARAGAGPWVSRAREHLAQLGAPTLGEADVDVRGIAPEKRGPWQRPMAIAAADLQKCMEGKPLSRVVLEIGVPAIAGSGEKKDAKAAKDKPHGRDARLRPIPVPAPQVNPGVAVHEDGPGASQDATPLECVRKRAERIKLPRPKDSPVVVSIGVIAR